LLIAHKDEIEALLEAFGDRGKVTDKDYLVLGTIDRADWKRGVLPMDELRDSMHDFKMHRDLVVTGGWGPQEPAS
jgi:hypothetical protein